jgi:hypothetical protein
VMEAGVQLSIINLGDHTTMPDLIHRIATLRVVSGLLSLSPAGEALAPTIFCDRHTGLSSRFLERPIKS